MTCICYYQFRNSGNSTLAGEDAITSFAELVIAAIGKSQKAYNSPMRTLLASLLILLATPAFAQFPPPGVYLCAVETGEEIGELNLFVAGDYSFKNVDGNSASGQVASAGTDINPLSGPLRDMNWTGSFATDATGTTMLRFVAPDGLEISCS